MSFASNVSVDYSFTENLPTSDLVNLVNILPFTGGFTATGDARVNFDAVVVEDSITMSTGGGGTNLYDEAPPLGG